jgi:hypothetical protein
VSNIDYERLAAVQSESDFEALDDDHKNALRGVAQEDSDAYYMTSDVLSDAPDEG